MRKRLFMVLILQDHDDPECVAEAVIEALRDCHFLKTGENLDIVSEGEHNTLLFYRSFPIVGFRR